MNNQKSNFLLEILPFLGIAFWFLLAFPLADRNESYLWITYLEKYSIWGIIENSIPSVRSFRPLAQVSAWCLYHLSGSNGVLIQFLNFLVLCAAIRVMISIVPSTARQEARLFYLMIGFVYFSAFYYIFNLHGIFYSAILLYLALMLKADADVFRKWKKWLLISFILAMFHPLILIFCMASLIGWFIEKQQINGKNIIRLGAVMLVLMILLQQLLPFPFFSVFDYKNLLGTMSNVESYAIVKMVTLLLCPLTLIRKTRPQQVLLGIVIILYLPPAIIFDLPVLLLLGSLTVLSLVMDGKWSLAGLVVAAILFPVTVGSGAPTKASILIFLLPYVLLRNVTVPFVRTEWIPKVTSFVVLTAVLSCAILMRFGRAVPVLSSLVRPVLVEKGKTFQLEEALTRAQQQTPQRRIMFLQKKQSSIRDKGQPKKRDNFPPTRQKELDFYQQDKLGKNFHALPAWYVAFGTEVRSDTLSLVYTLTEENCQPAYVYEAIPAPSLVENSVVPVNTSNR